MGCVGPASDRFNTLEISFIEEINEKQVISTKTDTIYEYLPTGEEKEPYLLGYSISRSRDEDESAFLEEIDQVMKELDLALADEGGEPQNQAVTTGKMSSNCNGQTSKGHHRRPPKNPRIINNSLQTFDNRRAGDDSPSYLVEHLATFGVGSQFGVRWPEDGLRKLKQMERSSAIWAQRMVLRLRRDVISVEDENGEIVEQFPLHLVTDPTAYISQDPRDVYNNLLVFTVNEDRQRRSTTPTEMHMFQVKLVAANEVAEDIRLYLDGHFTQVPPGLHDTGFEVRWEPQPSYPAPRPPVSRSPSRGGYRQQDVRLNRAESSYSAREDYAASPDYFERDVNTLNRCFDDIERFVSRVQSAALAQRDLDMIARQRAAGTRRGRPPAEEPALKARAQLPPESEFVAIFQKFRLCFNLLAKLKNHIHEPNAPELLHFLFTPLVLILDACQWGLGRNVAQNVVSPLLTREAKDLLLNCLTSKEMDVWISMGEAWRTAAQDWPHPAPNSYTPTFDGLPSSIRSSPPVNGNGNGNGVEPVARQRFDYERERLAVKEEALRERERMLEEERQSLRHMKRRFDEERRSIASDHPPHLEDDFPSRRVSRSMVDLHRETQRGIERDIPITLSRSNGYSPRQRSYLDELRAHRSKAVQVTYDRVGQNSKELTVKKGEHLEVLNDSRKWWECRNASGRIGFVPNTILTVVDPSTTKTYQNGGTRSSYDEPLFVRPGGSNSGPPSATYAHQERNIGGGSTSPHGNPYAPGGPDTPEYLRKRIGRKGEFRYF